MVCSRTISTPTGRVRSLERKIDNEIHNKIALLWKLACLQLVRNVGDCGRLLFRKLSFFPPFYLLRGGRVDQGDPPNPVNCLDWIEQQGHVIWASIQKADAVGALHEFCFLSLILSLSFSFGTLYDELQSETVIKKKKTAIPDTTIKDPAVYGFICFRSSFVDWPWVSPNIALSSRRCDAAPLPLIYSCSSMLISHAAVHKISGTRSAQNLL